MTQPTLLPNLKNSRRLDWLLEIANKQRYDFSTAHGCAEPGYDDNLIALGNWNTRTKWVESLRKCIEIDDTMPRIAKLLEKLGYECEWEDEWAVCDHCGKAVRTSASSYSWKRYYWWTDDGILCGNCVKRNPEDYLQWLSGNANNYLALDIDLSLYGYTKHTGEYQSGWHTGQDDDPKTIAKALRKEGIVDFVFTLDEKGQFDMTFSVWVKYPESA